MTSPTEALLRLQNLAAMLDDVVLFTGVCADVAAGHCLQIESEIDLIGSTLLAIVAGRVAPAAGGVLVDQRPPRSGQVRAVLNESDFGQDRPVGIQVAERIGNDGRDRLFGELDLVHRVDHEPWAMSAGEFRRIEIATSCAQLPRVLVVQEPERRLDRAALEQTISMLSTAKHRGAALIISTIDDRVTEQLVDGVLLMSPER